MCEPRVRGSAVRAPAPELGRASCPGWEPHLPETQAGREPSVQTEKGKKNLSPCVCVCVHVRDCLSDVLSPPPAGVIFLFPPTHPRPLQATQGSPSLALDFCSAAVWGPQATALSAEERGPSLPVGAGRRVVTRSRAPCTQNS